MPYMKWKARHANLSRLKKQVPRYVVQFPDLSVEQHTAPTSDIIPCASPKRDRIPGAVQFPIGHSHKQGLELITPGMIPYLAYLGGKKS